MISLFSAFTFDLSLNFDSLYICAHYITVCVSCKCKTPPITERKDRQTYMGHAPGSTMTNGVYTTFSPDITAQNNYDIYGDWYPEF